MKRIFFTLSLLAGSLFSFAQTGGYAFMNYETPYQSIVGGTGTRVLATSFVGFDPLSFFTNVPIGFRFRFADSFYTHINVAPDGYAWLGNSSPAVGLGDRTRPVTTDLGHSVVLSPMGMFSHESTVTGATPRIAYHTWGKAPFRVFTIEWKDNATLDNLDKERLSFQLMLHETYNNIEFSYDTMIFNHNNRDTVEVGIRGYLNNDFTLLENAGTRPWDSVRSTIDPGNFCILSNNLFPKKGLTYIFFDPLPYMAIVSPNEGETFQQGDRIDVEFASAILTGDKYRISFSSDSGATYTVLAADTIPAASGSGRKFSFTAPAVVSNKCFVKVQASGVTDSNDVAFTITGPTGIEHREVKQLDVYPNPVRDRISVSGDGLPQVVQATIFDITGKVVRTEKVNTAAIDVSALREGYYFIRIADGDRQYTGRFVINR